MAVCQQGFCTRQCGTACYGLFEFRFQPQKNRQIGFVMCKQFGHHAQGA